MGKLFVWLKKPKEILKFLDNHILKIGIAFLLAFIPLYPKFPLFDIHHTWVYIRFEDLLVAVVVLAWFTQLARKKVNLKTPLTLPIFAYWFVGGVSLLFSLVFLRTQIANFFPNVAILHYLRRIEYILPFFIAVSTIKSLRDVKHYVVIISLTLLGVVFYGFGQKYLGFPAFLTMNEEFSKGVPLYLPPTARMTSTFAGHYDLAAYLVFAITFLGSLIFGLRSKIGKFALFILVFLAYILLLFTASRVSFGVYLLAVSFMLYLQRKKWLIVPVLVLSIFLMTSVSGASERFVKTFRIERVVYNTKTGKPIAVLEELQKSSTTQEVTMVPPSSEDNLPLGSGFLTVPILEKNPEATNVATIRRSMLTSLKTATSASEIATISGDFLIRRTIVYDISFTTRFQGEWPRAWEAFKRNPALGSGYSSISLATDNDYLRALGETGALGFFTFLAIFFIAILALRRALKGDDLPFERSVLIGMGAGFLSLLLNATLIDIFEASKVAFSFWMVLGITIGMVKLKKTPTQSLFQEALEIARLPVASLLVFFALAILLFNKAINNYFVGDDFTWLRWAADTSKADIARFFFYADGFFYRPLAKAYFTLIRPFFEIKPPGYHFVDFLLHFVSTIAVYFITLNLTKKKLFAFGAGLFFLLHPVNAESVFWIASTSANFAVLAYFGSFLFYLWWREARVWWGSALFILSLLFFALGIFSHEVALMLPLILFLFDWLFTQRPKRWLYRFLSLLPYFLIFDIYLWMRVGAQAAGLSGDYGYSYKNLIFNVFGNFWGYLGVLVAGEKFIPLYDLSRSFFRLHSLWAGGILVVLLPSLIIFLRQSGRVKKWLTSKDSKIFIFAFGWFIIGLLPFWGLGNIAERHVYLASFGYVLALAGIVSLIWEKLSKRKVGSAFVVSSLFILVAAVYYAQGMIYAQKTWTRAGETANRILLAVSSNYADFPPNTTLYFVGLPLRIESAWIFPVGLEDGFWFIYKDKSLRIEKARNVEEALDLVEKNKPAHVLIFDNGELKEARREE